ncbi:MAG: MaoC family dehydratase [bacterium]|nr:hypothetical protein [Gammaproteobacteria bacterium]
MVDDYFAGLEIDRPLSDVAGHAVPSMLAGSADSFHEASRFQQDKGHLWMRQEWELNQPLSTRESYVAHAVIEDIYRRRNRTVVNTAMTLNNAADEVVVRSKHHQSFLLDEPVEQVQFRDPGKKEGARKFIVPEGSELESIDALVTLEMCGQFFHGSRSYHTDLNASLALGFQDVVVGGFMTMSYVGHLLEQYFGNNWWNAGRLDIKFTNPLWPDEHINIRGVATGPCPDDKTRQEVFAWIEKDDHTIVLIANASAPLA